MNDIKNEEQFRDFFGAIPFWSEIDGKLQNQKEFTEIVRINTLKLRELATECLEERQLFWILGIYRINFNFMVKSLLR